MTAESLSSTHRDTTEIPCAKCGQLNPHGSDICLRCQKHLYIHCHKCGHTTLRANRTCDACQCTLHPPRKPRPLMLRPPMLALFVVAVAFPVGMAVLGNNLPEVFQKAEVSMFGSLFDYYGSLAEMPLRRALPMHFVTGTVVLGLPFGLVGLVLWGSRRLAAGSAQPVEPAESSRQ